MVREDRCDACGEDKYPQPTSDDESSHQRGGARLAVRECGGNGARQVRPRLDDEGQRTDDVGDKHVCQDGIKWLAALGAFRS